MDKDNLKEFDSVDVKPTSINTENNTFSSVESENGPELDDQEIYEQECKYLLKVLLGDQRLCELCKQIYTLGFMPVTDVETDVTFNPSSPEVKSSSKAVICSSCCDSLNTNIRSIKNSSDLEDEISNTPDEKEGLFQIKTEEIDGKSEEDEDGSTSGSDDESSEDETSQNHKVTREILSSPHQSTNDDSSEAHIFKCQECEYKTKYKHSLKHHLLTHKDTSKMATYKCDECDYDTIFKHYLKRHQLKHRGISHVETFKCHTCYFETKYKHGLANHQLTHVGGSNTPASLEATLKLSHPLSMFLFRT